MVLLFIPQMIYECGEPHWNDTDWGKLKKTPSQSDFIHHKSHMA
jgi:hypothetical protein